MDESPERAVAERPLDDVETEICTLAGQIAAATARFLTLIADFDTRRGWASWQLHSCAQWLSWKAGVSLHTAREYVRVAGALTELPHIAAAFAAGTLSYSKVRALTRVATADTEESLLRIALQSPAAHLDRLCRGLATQTRTPTDDADRCTGRWFYDDDGTLVITARLRPDDGARFLAALARAEYERTRTTDTDGEPDLTAPPPPNPVPALIAMADTVRTVTTDAPLTAPGAEVLVHLGTADTPDVAPHAHLDDGPGLDTATLAGLLCSATLRLVKHGRLGHTIEWGHSRYRPTRAQVRILVLRDRCCTVPGCGRTRFLHAHHVAFWSHGGTTDLDNLILLCGEHHRTLHDGCFTITAHGQQQFTFHHPCGRRIDYAPTLTGDADDLTRRYQHIAPDAITADWSGEGLDISFATDVLLRNWELDQRRRQKLAA